MLKIADHTFSSRLFTGTGKFARPELMAAAIEASGSQLVTMAIKRLEPGKAHDDILSPLLQLGVKLLPNTSGAKTAAEAVFAAHLAREALGTNWLKLEIHPDPRYLLPLLRLLGKWVLRPVLGYVLAALLLRLVAGFFL